MVCEYGEDFRALCCCECRKRGSSGLMEVDATLLCNEIKYNESDYLVYRIQYYLVREKIEYMYDYQKYRSMQSFNDDRKSSNISLDKLIPDDCSLNAYSRRRTRVFIIINPKLIRCHGT